MKKQKSELAALKLKIQLTISPKQEIQANEEQNQAAPEMKQQKCADSSQSVRIRV
ncbi:hypothetical protein [Paludibacter propionicigenes]|uniref:hypothetical protein n=1 Tax=Paludibacter propionicigenes TaxID=185300 RepID=UPI0003179090|nr:hypothetical protein [Paludibacter propionicigenes]